jgi:hypothetical protein
LILKSISVVLARCSFLTLLAILITTSAASGQEAPPPTPDPTTPHGTILFKRDQDSQPAEKPAAKTPEKPQKTSAESSANDITDAERASLIFTSYDLNVHLTPAASQLAVHAAFTVQNSGKHPLKRLALQLSSSLQWESIALQSAGKVTPFTFTQHPVDTDADHTGQATEAVISLPQPLAPGATAELTAFYSGKVEQSGERLIRIGAPPEQASNADWDRIAPDRTALRGFGNVLWYPTAAAPVFLGDGAKLFESVGQTKLQQSAANVHLRLSVEYVGDAPDAAFFCGRREQLTAVNENTDLPVSRAPGVATADFAARPLGFRTPSLFVTDRAGTVTADDLISAVTEHPDTLPNYDAGAEKVRPLLTDWLGTGPLDMLYLLDQPGQPFEDDALLIAPMHTADAAALAPSLVHSLSHAWFHSSHIWLDEGVAQFLSLLWIEQGDGREVAVRQLEQGANTLALAEPVLTRDTLPDDEGQSLIHAHDEVYYRTKGTAVLWMLRAIVGEDALKHALQTYRKDKNDADPKQFQHVLETASKRELGWFFDDWVYRDRGLPDLSIANVTPRILERKDKNAVSWLVAVEVRNDGDAVAEVPVTVRSGTLTSTQRLRIPGRSSASTRMVFEGTPEEVIVNDGGVPEMSASTHTKELIIK